MFYSLFLYGIIYWIFKNIPIRNSVGGLEWYEYVCNGGFVECVRVRTMGERGSNFFPFWCVRTN